jgi:hypothetical protein
MSRKSPHPGVGAYHTLLRFATPNWQTTGSLQQGVVKSKSPTQTSMTLTITQHTGTTPSVTRTFTVVAKNSGGTAIARGTKTTTTGSHTLTATHYTIISWTAVSTATTYIVYVLTGTNYDKIGSVSASPFDYTGQAKTPNTHPPAAANWVKVALTGVTKKANYTATKTVVKMRYLATYTPTVGDVVMIHRGQGRRNGARYVIGKLA